MKKSIATLFLILASVLLAQQSIAENSTRVYTPLHQTADSLEQHLDELYNKEISFTVSEGRLIIRGEQALIAQVEQTLTQLDTAPRLYSVSIASRLPGTDSEPLNADKRVAAANTKVYRSRPRNPAVTYQLRENTLLRLAHREQSRPQFTALPNWVLVESVADKQEYLELSFTTTAQSVVIDISWLRKDKDDRQSLSGSLTGDIDSWIEITGALERESPYTHTGQNNQAVLTDTRTTARDDQLYIKISPVTK